ncbi:unnamed protein product [Clavelina lepadiformis]|uniref:Uncharacterized protein n=1 Tax=Clavelina lepadiformis TaxID=159417 RepID=A0ABP0FSM2_CLALP
MGGLASVPLFTNSSYSKSKSDKSLPRTSQLKSSSKLLIKRCFLKAGFASIIVQKASKRLKKLRKSSLGSYFGGGIAKHSCRGGVVKATDSKSVEPSPRTFKSRRQSRYYFCNFIWILHMHIHMNMKPGGEWRVLILQWKNRRTSIDKLQVQTSEPQSDEPTTV